MKPDIPLDIPLIHLGSEITSEWLSSALRRPVNAVKVTRIGTGQLGCTYRASFDGESLVVKTAASDEDSRAAGVSTLAYRREVAFYRALCERPPIAAVARCHGAAISEDCQWFTLLLDDLSHAQAGNQLIGISPEDAANAFAAMAEIQAATLQDLRLQNSDWLRLPWPLTQDLYQSALPGFIQRYADSLSADHANLVTALATRIDSWRSAEPTPIGIAHGDFRPDNLLFTTDACMIVDWQSVSIAPLGRDLAYLLGGGITTHQRREHERSLVEDYAARVSALSGARIDTDELWLAYRHQSLYGLIMTVIASMLVEQTVRGDQMFTTMLARHADHALDLEATRL